jgi:hypothetical protein
MRRFLRKQCMQNGPTSLFWSPRYHHAQHALRSSEDAFSVTGKACRANPRRHHVDGHICFVGRVHICQSAHGVYLDKLGERISGSTR